MEAPREKHLVAVKRILCYMVGTRCWGVRYCAGRGRKKLELVGYSDSDMAGDVDDRKSTSRMINFLSSGRSASNQLNRRKLLCLLAKQSTSPLRRQAHRGSGLRD